MFRLHTGSAVISIALLATGCDGEFCMSSMRPRCEGQLLVYCPGGWGTLDMTTERTDCSAQGEHCVNTDFYGTGNREGSCMKSLGACDPQHYRRECHPGAAPAWGSFLECIGGQLFASGPSCSTSTTPD
jgi:hypothetical protein